MSSTAAELVQIVESAGGRFKIDGDRLGIVPGKAAEPVMESLRQHKREIINLLQTRSDSEPDPDPARAEPMPALPGNMPALPSGVRLIRWEPKSAPIKLSRCSTVTHAEKFIATTLLQLSARLSGQSWQSGNWSLSTLIERLAACGCVVALDDPKQALQ